MLRTRLLQLQQRERVNGAPQTDSALDERVLPALHDGSVQQRVAVSHVLPISQHIQRFSPGGRGDSNETDAAFALATYAIQVPDGFVPVNISRITQHNNPRVTLCRVPVDVMAQSRTRASTLDQAAAAFCAEKDTLTLSLSVVARMPTVRAPTGFLFRQSRSGGTAVANMLLAVQYSMVRARAHDVMMRG